MIFKTETTKEWWSRISVWHRHYAWLPIWNDGFVAWLSYVERRAVLGSDYDIWYWEYRLPEPELTPGEEFLLDFEKSKRNPSNKLTKVRKRTSK